MDELTIRITMPGHMKRRIRWLVDFEWPLGPIEMPTPAGTLARPGGSKTFGKGEEVSATVISYDPLILSVPGLTRLTTLIEGTHFEFIDEEAEENG
jgi:hypothetical protein